MNELTDSQWAQYERDGFFILGKVLTDDELAAMQRRIDDIMLGRAEVSYDRMLMQLDSSSGRYEDAGAQTKGHKGATLDYRKIQDLEFDPVFLRLMQRPIFRQICARAHGAGAAISCFRAMFMNKPAHKGTFLPWHQDRWDYLDRDPLVTIWLALDPATIENGCVQIIPGTQHELINPGHPSGFLTEAQAEEHCPVEKRVHLELKPGEAALLHNWTVHGSDVNRSSQSRRAFSVCYMDARTRHRAGRESYSVIFGEGALDPENLAPAAA